GSNYGWSFSMITLPPTMPVYNEDGTFNNYNPVRYVGGGHVNTDVALAHLTEANTTRNNLMGSIYGEYEILEGLFLKSSLGYKHYNSRYDFYRPSYMPYNIAYDNEYGNALSDVYLRRYMVTDHTITLNRDMGDHHLNVMGGFSYQNDVGESMYIRGGGLTNDITMWNEFAAIPQD